MEMLSLMGMKRPAIVTFNVQPFAVPERMREIRGTGRPRRWGGEVGQVGSRERARGWGGVRGVEGGFEGEVLVRVRAPRIGLDRTCWETGVA
jgi:hypothetical protein